MNFLEHIGQGKGLSPEWVLKCCLSLLLQLRLLPHTSQITEKSIPAKYVNNYMLKFVKELNLNTILLKEKNVMIIIGRSEKIDDQNKIGSTKN